MMGSYMHPCPSCSTIRSRRLCRWSQSTTNRRCLQATFRGLRGMSGSGTWAWHGARHQAGPSLLADVGAQTRCPIMAGRGRTFKCGEDCRREKAPVVGPGPLLALQIFLISDFAIDRLQCVVDTVENDRSLANHPPCQISDGSCKDADFKA